MKKRTKKTLGVAIKVFTRVLLGIVLCAILNVSMQFVKIGVLGDEVGYRVMNRDTGKTVEEHRYTGDETPSLRFDVPLEETEYTEAIFEASHTTSVVMDGLTQILLLIVLGIFPYHILWQFGNRDDTNVRYKGQRPEPFRGVKIGCIAMIPFALLWLVLVVGKFAGFDCFQIYNLSNFPFIHFNTFVLGNIHSIFDVAMWRLFLLLPTLLFVPAVCGIAYRLGGKQFSLAEFVTFKKKKEQPEEEEI